MNNRDKILLAALSAISIAAFKPAHAEIMHLNPISLTVAQTVRTSYIAGGLAPTSASIIAAQARMSASLASAVRAAKNPVILAVGAGLVIGTVLKGSSNPDTPNIQPVQIASNNDGTVTTTKTVYKPPEAPPPATETGEISPNTMAWQGFSGKIYATPFAAIADSMAYFNANGSGMVQWYVKAQGYSCINPYPSGSYYGCGVLDTENMGSRSNVIVAFGTYPQTSCPANNYLEGGVCVPMTPPTPNPNDPGNYTPTSKTQTLEQAIGELTPEELAQPLSPESIANLVNALGNQINQDPTYGGPPLPTNISPSQVSDAIGIIGVRPTVGDMTKPVTPEQVAYDPISSPSQQTGTTVPINGSPSTTAPAPAPSVPDATSKPDFGIDPGIQTPALEGIPTAQNILSPILNMLPGFRTFQLPAHSGVCPVGRFSIFGKEFVLETHCWLLEELRPVITPMATAAWGILAVIIFLGA